MTRTKRNKLPLLADIVQARFERGSEKLFYKTDLDGEEMAVDVLKQAAACKKMSDKRPLRMTRKAGSQKKAAVEEKQNGNVIFHDKLPSPRQVPRGISMTKKQKIVQNLVPRMESGRRSFWENLPESELSEDLLKTFE